MYNVVFEIVASNTFFCDIRNALLFSCVNKKICDKINKEVYFWREIEKMAGLSCENSSPRELKYYVQKTVYDVKKLLSCACPRICGIEQIRFMHLCLSLNQKIAFYGALEANESQFYDTFSKYEREYECVNDHLSILSSTERQEIVSTPHYFLSLATNTHLLKAESRELAMMRACHAIVQLANNVDLWIASAKKISCQSFPPNIDWFRGLKKIVLHNVDYLPRKIGSLTSLKSLSLHADKEPKKKSPHVFKFHRILELTNLSALTISNYRIKKLSESLGRLTQLKSLTLNGNDLLLVPLQIFKLGNLLKLNLADNKIKCISQKITKLTALKSLNLQNNALKQLPESLTKLTSLEKLFVKQNAKLQSLPEGLCLKQISRSLTTQLPVSHKSTKKEIQEAGEEFFLAYQDLQARKRATKKNTKKYCQIRAEISELKESFGLANYRKWKKLQIKDLKDRYKQLMAENQSLEMEIGKIEAQLPKMTFDLSQLPNQNALQPQHQEPVMQPMHLPQMRQLDPQQFDIIQQSLGLWGPQQHKMWPQDQELLNSMYMDFEKQLALQNTHKRTNPYAEENQKTAKKQRVERS